MMLRDQKERERTGQRKFLSSFFFLLFKGFFFLIWTIFKVVLEFVTLLFLFYVLVFGHEAPGNLSS